MAFNIEQKKKRLTGWTELHMLPHIWGNKKNNKVVRVDNWSKGNWSVDIGIELPPKEGIEVSYKWTQGNYFNGSKEDAFRVAKEYMMANQ